MRTLAATSGNARLLIATFVLFVANVTFASDDAANAFRMSGSGSLTLNPAEQKNGDFILRATLAPTDAAVASQPPVQSGSGFALMAAVTSSVQVCYNDTIFRDDFDGDGG
jgi:hypothetical protein